MERRIIAAISILVFCQTTLSARTDEEQLSIKALVEKIREVETVNTYLVKEIDKLKDEHQKTVSELNDRIFQLEKAKSDSGNPAPCHHGNSRGKRLLLSDNGVVAFSAAIKNISVPHYNNGETIIFETIISNIGGHYSKDDGIFVAPIKGLYMFSCSVLDDQYTENMLHAEIAVNNVPIARIFAFAEHNRHRDQGAQTVFIEINQGDHVRVRHIDEDNGTVGGELYTTFSGYLLWPIE